MNDEDEGERAKTPPPSLSILSLDTRTTTISSPPTMSRRIVCAEDSRPKARTSSGNNNNVSVPVFTLSTSLSSKNGIKQSSLIEAKCSIENQGSTPATTHMSLSPQESTENQTSSHHSLSISLSQVLNHSPFESEADTYLQQALEEAAHATCGVVRETQASILNHVPLNYTPPAFHPDYATSGGAAASRTVTPTHSGNARNSGILSNTLLPHHRKMVRSTRQRRVESTAESLYTLAKDLDAINSMPGSYGGVVDNMESNSINPDDGIFPGRVDADLAAVEMLSLLKNADILMKNELETYRSSQAHLLRQGHLQNVDQDVVSELNRSNQNKKCDKQDVSTDKRNEVSGVVPNLVNESLKISNTNMIEQRWQGLTEEYKDFEDWLRYKRNMTWSYCKAVLVFIMLPCTGVATILFYAAGNPPCQFEECTNSSPPNTSSNSLASPLHIASASWWLLFLGCRQVVTFSVAHAMDAIIIDYVALRTTWAKRVLGPFLTLFVVQSKGWPFQLFFWAVFDFIVLFGHSRFANHWLFYQNAIDMFNASNPSGDIPDADMYTKILAFSVVIAVTTAIKRFYVGIRQGKSLYVRFGEELSRVMRHSLMISKVAKLGRDIESSNLRFDNNDFKACPSYTNGQMDDGSACVPVSEPTNEKSLSSGVYRSTSFRAKVNEMLGEWEEPEFVTESEHNPDIGDIIQFKQSLSYLYTPLPFGLAFGPFSSREECLENSEILYNRLLQSTPDEDMLNFDVIAMLAVSDSTELDGNLLKHLIRVFRPDREGRLTLLDFAKSADVVYKELRVLRASVANASRLDRAFERIYSFFFYCFLFIISMLILGLSPFAMIASFSAFIVGFAFMINIACSSWIQGILLILVRRPYNVGDRVHISQPWQDTDPDGSPGWIVKDVNLFSTTVVLGTTNEVATYNNGSLANFRIINGARSRKAVMSFAMKFPIDTLHSKIQLFRSAVEHFVRARPREWAAFIAFRISRMEADKGFVEYIGRAQHRETWQDGAVIAQSRADLSSFALELAKKMNIRYVSPPMPIDLRMTSQGGVEAAAESLGGFIDVAGKSNKERGTSMDDSVVHNVAQMFDTDLTSWKTPLKSKKKQDHSSGEIKEIADSD